MSAQRLSSHMPDSDLFTESLAQPSPLPRGHGIIESALLHLLEARKTFVDAVNPWQSQPSHPLKATPTSYLVDGYNPQPRRELADVMACWQMSNRQLEHTISQYLDQPRDHYIVNLNDLIKNIISVLYNSAYAHAYARYLKNNDMGVTVAGVDVGIATRLPEVVAPPLLLQWVFSELLITSWLNSLPHNPFQNGLHIPMTSLATVVVTSLDTPDAWHITISSDQHHASHVRMPVASLTQALQHLGGDVVIACDEDALLQTVVLPKYPRL